jgi:hypothetical protein
MHAARDDRSAVNAHGFAAFAAVADKCNACLPFAQIREYVATRIEAADKELTRVAVQKVGPGGPPRACCLHLSRQLNPSSACCMILLVWVEGIDCACLPRPHLCGNLVQYVQISATMPTQPNTSLPFQHHEFCCALPAGGPG